MSPRRRLAHRRLLAIAVPLALAALAPDPSRASDAVRVEASGSELSKAVAAALRERVPLEPAAAVTVTDRQGTVVLGGWTATLGAREWAASVAESTPGVRFVEMRMAVRPSRKLDDGQLRDAVRQALAAEGGFAQPVHVDVAAADGVVTLSGTARTPEDKDRAHDLVYWLDGPRDVVDAIRLDPEAGRRRLEVELVRLFEVRQLPVEDLQVRDLGDRLEINGEAYDVVAREIVDRYLAELPGGRTVVNGVRCLVTTPPRR